MQMKDNEFDLIVRSVMHDAEEQVPSRVWSSVSSQIGKAGTAKVVALSWKRIAAGVAAAAAVVAGVFIFGTTTISQTNTETDMVADLSVDVETVQSAPVAVVPEVDNGQSSLIAQSSPAVMVGEDAPSVQISEETAPAVEQQERVADAAVEESTRRDEPVRTEGPQNMTDPFAQMVYEDSHMTEHRGISFKIGGDVSTNSNAAGISRSRMSRPDNTERSITQISKESTYSVPISFGLGIRIPISERWSVGTGLTYSFLERTFAGTYKEFEGGIAVNTINADIRHSIHYAGIPLNFSYDILSGRRTQFYAFAGGSVEKAFLNKFRIPTDASPLFYSESVKGVQASAAAGLGVNFLITDHFGFYLDPSVRYYFNCGQPVNIRTQQPFMMSLELGFRFNL